MIVIENFECDECEAGGYYITDDEVYCVDCDTYQGELSDFNHHQISKSLFPSGGSSAKSASGTNVQVIMDLNNDPYKKQENALNMNPPTVNTILNLETYKRKHQTLVLVNVRKDASGTCVERATRFVTSLNTQDAIKADIMSASDGNVYAGLVWTGTSPGGIDVQEIGRKLGFTQVVELTYTGNE